MAFVNGVSLQEGAAWVRVIRILTERTRAYEYASYKEFARVLPELLEEFGEDQVVVMIVIGGPTVVDNNYFFTASGRRAMVVTCEQVTSIMAYDLADAAKAWQAVRPA